MLYRNIFEMYINGEKNKYKKWIKKQDRPTWDEYFLNIADVVSTRSIDANTKYGCVLVDENNHIVGTGYNSFPRGFPDNKLPNFRTKPNEPDCPKYKKILHSEVNALSNITTKNYSKLTCYLTGVPCVNCLDLLYQNRVTRIVCSRKYSWANEDMEEFIEHFYWMSPLSLETLDERLVFDSLRDFTGVKKLEWVKKRNQ